MYAVLKEKVPNWDHLSEVRPRIKLMLGASLRFARSKRKVIKNGLDSDNNQTTDGQLRRR